VADHQTEEQQVEALKEFWNEYGNAIITGLVIGFAGFIGYGYYKDNKLTSELYTSEAYQSMTTLADSDKAAFRSAGEQFIADNGDSSYSTLTALALAKDAADHKDWTQAEKHLKTAIEKSTDAGIKAIAVVRLARVQMQLEQYDTALATISQALPESFKAEVEEIKGDAYLKQEKVDMARAAYQVALDASGERANPVLQMKLDDLAQEIVLTK